jgi:hypothetical protein
LTYLDGFPVCPAKTAAGGGDLTIVLVGGHVNTLRKTVGQS